MALARKRINTQLFQLESIARSAGLAIIEVYNNKEFNISLKADHSPLTAADLASEKVIRDGLLQLPDQYLIISEESDSIPFEERSKAERLWLVDPLDGTKEFLKRNNDFCVCIALIEGGRPILAVIHAPVSGKSYLASKGGGAHLLYADGHHFQLSPKPRSSTSKSAGLRFGVSRSHLNTTTKNYLSKFESPVEVPMGSALKFCALAEGMIDVYPRFGQTMEWDTAAGDLIVQEIGGSVLNVKTMKPLVYNKATLENSAFIAKR